MPINTSGLCNASYAMSIFIVSREIMVTTARSGYHWQIMYCLIPPVDHEMLDITDRLCIAVIPDITARSCNAGYH